MKKDVAASAAGAVALKKPEFSLIDEDLLKSRIYTIRGVKVMLDADLAEIYGYSTKDFNRQVKNNIERFAEDFRFQLTKREVEELRSKKFTAITDANDAKDLRCKNCTANISTMSRSNPYVFTEQGIYMLMTVLKGDLAVQQSMALIRLFKQMKDYIAAENAPDVSAGMVALATQTSQNTRDIAEIATDVRTLSSKVERNESFLQKVMANFIDPSTFKHFLILNGQRFEADVAYTQIYGMAKKSVLIVDDYLDVKTLDLLRCVAKGVSVQIFSEQHGRTRLTESMLADFRAARPDVELGDIRATGTCSTTGTSTWISGPTARNFSTAGLLPKTRETRSRPSCSWKISPCIAHCLGSCYERGNRGFFKEPITKVVAKEYLTTTQHNANFDREKKSCGPIDNL